MNKRLEELDSLRGLAAFSVLLSHFIGTLPHLPWWFSPLEQSPVHIFWAGHQAVVFFFVLSGFVLSLPFLESKSLPYPGYFMKRILRIYPPYICAVALALFCREWLYAGPVPNVGDWFNQSWLTPVTWSIVKAHIIMIGPFRNNDYNPVLWSLIHEMRISLIFPALIYLVRYKEKASIVLACATTIGCMGMFYLEQWNVIVAPGFLRTVSYIGTFIVGALLAKHRALLVQWFVKISRKGKWLLFGVSVLLYTWVLWFPRLVGFINQTAADLLSLQILGEVVTTMGVALFIIASLSARKFSSFLKLKPLSFLGKISYSLYLFHGICLKVVITALHLAVPMWLLLVISFIASFVVSSLSYYWIEIPSIDLGRWIAKRYFSNRRTQVEGGSANLALPKV